MNDARGAYDAWHDALSVDATADSPWHDLVRDHLNPARDLSGRRVLEIAAGRGGFAAWLGGGERSPRAVVAADFSPVAVRKGAAHARARGLTPLRWTVADAQRLPHPDGTFDTVISCETVEHVPDPRRAVAEFARVLRRRGRLFLTTPSYLGLMGLYRLYRRLTGRPFTEEGQPVNHLTSLPRTRHWVRRAGLRVVRVAGVGHYLPVPGRAPIRLTRLDRGGAVTRWAALHSFVLAEKP